MRVFPVRKLARVLRELSELSQSTPDARALLISKFSWDINKEGDLDLSLDASTPVPVSGAPVNVNLGSRFRRHMLSLGTGETLLVVQIGNDVTGLSDLIDAVDGEENDDDQITN
jgi:hypothetical protein